jgi:hypothetical protein
MKLNEVMMPGVMQGIDKLLPGIWRRQMHTKNHDQPLPMTEIKRKSLCQFEQDRRL